MIEIIRKDIVIRIFECIEDEDFKVRVFVKFIGEDVIDFGGVIREFFLEFFCGFGVYSMLVRGMYFYIIFWYNLEVVVKGFFEIFGKFVVIVFVNGCLGFYFFMLMVVGFILDIFWELYLIEVLDDCEFLI